MGILLFGFAGHAGAMYMGDGSVQSGTVSNWTAPTDGTCVLGLHADGTLDVDTTITTKRDCDARLVSVTAVGTASSSSCTTSTKNTAGVKYASAGSSTCVIVDSSGNVLGSISLKNYDRTEAICNALGAARGVTAHLAGNVTNLVQPACIAYGWQFRGQDSTGTPLAFGSKGTDSTVTSNAGFCYTTMRTNLPAASCPTVAGSTSGTANSSSSAAFGYSVSGSYCLYAYGINGTVNAALNNIAGTAVYAAGATANLGQYTTLGACLANGGSWSNWMPVGPTATVGTLNGINTAVTFDLTREAVSGDDGCLHCHSTLVQYNGPAERWKDSYLQTGHKNMLRKVTPGMVWAGPNANGVLTVYTTDGTNAMTWGTLGVAGSATDGGKPMYYVYGDWMIPLPTVAIAGSGYSCANCHSTGFSGGTSTTPGVQSIGTTGYTGNQPADSGAGYVSAVKAGYKWDREGILCSRCHNATVPSVAAAQISASTFPSTAPTSGGMGALQDGVGRNNLCFGCHQSIAKLWPAQGGTSSGTTQYDPTIIPTGVSHGAAAGRDFNGHVLGNSFLNSVHARYAGAQSGNGSIKANALGENDLYDSIPTATSVAAEYNSIFKGFTCWQTATGNSPAKTKADGTEIAAKSDCDALYACSKAGNTTQSACAAAGGTWASTWRADTGGATDQSGTQGTCATCHDVHNSLFVAGQSEKAIRKTCEDCHMDNATTGATDANAPQVSTINHPQTPGTPFDMSLYGNDSCVVCHMATQAEKNGNQNSMPVHVWRINTNPNYNTFPTTGQFYGGTCSAHTGAVQNSPSFPVVYLSDTSSTNCTNAGGTWTAVIEDRNAQTAPEGNYNKAVWVDIDMACGQCHGGSLGSSATVNGAPYKTKGQLSRAANNIHRMMQ